MEKIEWVESFARRHTFTSVYFFLDAYACRWKKSIGFVFRNVLVKYKSEESTSYRDKNDLTRLDKFLQNLIINNPDKILNILDKIEANRILLMQFADEIQELEISLYSDEKLSLLYQKFFDLSILFWDYHSLGYYIANVLPQIKNDSRKEMEKRITKIRKYMPAYMEFENVVLSKLFKELGDRKKIPYTLLYYLDPKELLQIFKGKKQKIFLFELKKRRDQLSLFLVKNQKIRLLTGLRAEEEYEKQINTLCINSTKLEGATICIGNIVGPAFVVKNKEDLRLIPKEAILVIKNLLPDEIVFLKNAKGIISEEGGMGSHVAILARELKIPCIAGVVNATKLIHTSEMLKLNAQKKKGLIARIVSK
jgi:phosphohistidine swiveling domain-containing protein